jgi:hypothetical protein
LGFIELRRVRFVIILAKEFATGQLSYAIGAQLAHPKRYVLAQTIQWIGSLGVARMVQTGKDLGVGLGTQSKHSV